MTVTVRAEMHISGCYGVNGRQPACVASKERWRQIQLRQNEAAELAFTVRVGEVLVHEPDVAPAGGHVTRLGCVRKLGERCDAIGYESKT
jgi:hypothetical protein